MKSQKGVTLISLTIYVIVMAIVVGILSVITTFFYHNTKDFRDINPMLEYTTFNSYFSDEVNHSNIKIVKCYTGTTGGEQNYIIFNNGVQYTYIPANKGIYRNKVKIKDYRLYFKRLENLCNLTKPNKINLYYSIIKLNTKERENV